MKEKKAQKKNSKSHRSPSFNSFKNNSFKKLNLFDHLNELRRRLLYSFFFIFLSWILCWNYSDLLFDILRHPISPYLPMKGFIFTAPMEKFSSHLKVSFLAAFILASPLWLYQVWKFIAPGLYLNEKKASLAFVFFGTLLFLLGVMFVYFLVYPIAFKFLMNFGGTKDQAMISIKEYLSFFSLSLLTFGLAFELPLILSILGAIGMIQSDFLRKKRKYAIILLTTLAAVITPPDVISMTLMSVPLILLYEVSILSVQIFEKKEA